MQTFCAGAPWDRAERGHRYGADRRYGRESVNQTFCAGAPWDRAERGHRYGVDRR